MRRIWSRFRRWFKRVILRRPEPLFGRIEIPLMRRVYPQLIAERMVGVQPMMGDNPALIYYLRNHTHATNSGGRRSYVKEKVDWKREGF